MIYIFYTDSLCKVSAVLGYAEPIPAPHVQYCPPHHVGIQRLHFPPNVDLQLIKCGRPGPVHFTLQVAPEAEIGRG